MSAPALIRHDEDPPIPYVPTPMHIVKAMLDMARVGPEDLVLDLGSGDGRIVRTAAKDYGARGLGIEIDLERMRLAEDLARKEGVSERVTFIHRDLFTADVSSATVLTMYLLPEPVNRLRGQLLAQLKPGTRVISEDFRVRGWTAQKVARHIAREKQRAVGSPITFLWQYVIPGCAR